MEGFVTIPHISCVSSHVIPTIAWQNCLIISLFQVKTLRLQEIKQPSQDTWLLSHLGRYLKELPAPPPPSCWTLRGLQLVGRLVLLFPLCVVSLLYSQGTIFYSKVVERRL